jgi:hypothetical protein
MTAILSRSASYRLAVAAKADLWLPANGGTEEPFTTRNGVRLLYCFNPRLGRHAYLDLSCDHILDDEDAFRALGLL